MNNTIKTSGNRSSGAADLKNIRNTPEYREAKEAAKERAAGKSELSGKKCDELQAHHIVPVATNPNLACDLDNIICLTPEEHKAFHGLYGNGYEASAADFESFKNDFEAQITRAAKYAANRAKVANLYRQKGEKALAKFLKLDGYDHFYDDTPKGKDTLEFKFDESFEFGDAFIAKMQRLFGKNNYDAHRNIWGEYCISLNGFML